MEITTTSWLISEISSIQSLKLEYNNILTKLEIELQDSELTRRIMKGKKLLQEVEEKEIALKKQGIDILTKAGIKSFKWSWCTVSVSETAWRLIIEDDKIIPSDYKETVIKETIKIDKKNLKEDVKNGCIIEWVHIEKTVDLKIKFD